jgi:curli biogenesis system outer membrane secretion channel CsgG
MKCVCFVPSVLSLLLILTACGAPQQARKTVNELEQSQVNTDSVTVDERIAKSYNGPKIRVAVGEIKELEAALELYKELGWSGIGPSLTDQITTGLVNTGRVAVLERQQIKKVIGNLKLEKESNNAKYFNQATTKNTGKLLGAQAILIGAVTEFEPDVSGAEGGLNLGQMGGLRFHTDKAVVGVDVRLVDQESGKILAAANGKGEIETSTAGATAQYQGLSFGGQAWTRTPLGSATRAAALMALRKLVDGLVQIPWENRVVGTSGQKCFVGAGKDLNLKIGDEFVLIKRGDAIKSDDGSVLGHDETMMGRIKLTSVQGKMSIATVLDGGKAEKGMIVRLPNQP